MKTYKFTTENTSLLKEVSGYGHWKVTAYNIDFGFRKTITTSNSQLIDDAFNSEEGDTSFYESVEEAKQKLIDMIFSIFVIRDREAGNIIEDNLTINDALSKVEEYEKEDKGNGIYEEDFYEIYPQ